LVTANVTGPAPSLTKVKVRVVACASVLASRPMLLKVIVAGLGLPGVGVGPLGAVGPWLCEALEVLSDGPPELPAAAESVATATALDGDADAFAVDPLLWLPTIIKAPATPMSSAQTTPSTIEMFFQTLSSTGLLLSDPSTVGDGPGKDTASEPFGENHGVRCPIREWLASGEIRARLFRAAHSAPTVRVG
jgi:hypothetical protein